jgi:hypothetical protein
VGEEKFIQGFGGKIAGAEQVGTQRRKKEDLGSGQVAGSYEKDYAFSRSIKSTQFLTTSSFSRRTLLHNAHLRRECHNSKLDFFELLV